MTNLSAWLRLGALVVVVLGNAAVVSVGAGGSCKDCGYCSDPNISEPISCCLQVESGGANDCIAWPGGCSESGGSCRRIE